LAVCQLLSQLRDGGPAEEAMINDVYGLAIDKGDNLYFIALKQIWIAIY